MRNTFNNQNEQEKQSLQKWRYTAVKAPFLTVVGVFGGMILLESSMFLLLILLLIPNPTLKYLLTGGMVLLLLILVPGVMLSALRTHHTLTAAKLHLHYGHLLNITLLRTEIQRAQAVHERLPLMTPISARYDEKTQRITACFSEEGQVLLTLREPLMLKIGRKMQMAKMLLINVDRRDAFLVALGEEMLPIPISEGLHKEEIHLHKKQFTMAKKATLATKNSMGLRKTTVTTENAERPRKAILSTEDSIVLRVEGLTRRFKQFTAVDQLAMQVHRGEIYGLLGSNGAGKTTTIKMLVGLLMPSAGRIEIVGYDLWKNPQEVKRVLGYVPDRSLLYERLSGREYLEFLAQVRGLDLQESQERIEKLLELLELKEQAGRLCGGYSFGMKRKLALAGALLHQPQIIILDEPLNGLDPRSARRLKDLFLELAATGTTILLSTHDLASAEELCDRIGIFHRGQLLAEGSAAELRQIAEASDLEAVFLNLTDETFEEVTV